MPSRSLLLASAAVATVALIAGCGAMKPSGGNSMGFFITSANPGKGGDLGGLAGADRFCQSLATAAGAGGKTWRAYLSTAAMDGQAVVNARDRIGSGPWTNAKGVVVATSVADLHSANAKLGKDTSLTEKGEVVSGFGDAVNRHDILTGSRPTARWPCPSPARTPPAATGPRAMAAPPWWATTTAGAPTPTRLRTRRGTRRTARAAAASISSR